jgi:hypothetical protein
MENHDPTMTLVKSSNVVLSLLKAESFRKMLGVGTKADKIQSQPFDSHVSVDLMELSNCLMFSLDSTIFVFRSFFEISIQNSQEMLLKT